MSHPTSLRRIAVWNFSAILAGALIGHWLGPIPAGWTLIAWVPVSMVKGLAAPLLFLAIFHGAASDQITGRGVSKMFSICAVNMVAAIAIAVTLVDFLRPGDKLRDLVLSAGLEPVAAQIKKLTWMDAVKGLIPESVFGPFVQNNVPALIVLAVLFGVSLKAAAAKDPGFMPYFEKCKELSALAMNVILIAMGYVLRIMPIAILVSVAKSVGENGLGVMSGLLHYTWICLAGMLVQIVIVYQFWVKFGSSRSLSRFWGAAKNPVIHAFGVNSSLASLPLTLDALRQLRCRDGAARLGACVGTNFNNDGILLYEVMAVLILGQASGLDWDLTHQLMLAGVCIVATLGVSGFPEAGIIALSLVLTTAGLPEGLLPLLLPLDWLIARFRSVTNVLGDMTVSLAINGRSSREDA